MLGIPKIKSNMKVLTKKRNKKYFKEKSHRAKKHENTEKTKK